MRLTATELVVTPHGATVGTDECPKDSATHCIWGRSTRREADYCPFFKHLLGNTITCQYDFQEEEPT